MCFVDCRGICHVPYVPIIGDGANKRYTAILFGVSGMWKQVLMAAIKSGFTAMVGRHAAFRYAAETTTGRWSAPFRTPARCVCVWEGGGSGRWTSTLYVDSSKWKWTFANLSTTLIIGNEVMCSICLLCRTNFWINLSKSFFRVEIMLFYSCARNGADAILQHSVAHKQELHAEFQPWSDNALVLCVPNPLVSTRECSSTSL